MTPRLESALSVGLADISIPQAKPIKSPLTSEQIYEEHIHDLRKQRPLSNFQSLEMSILPSRSPTKPTGQSLIGTSRESSPSDSPYKSRFANTFPQKSKSEANQREKSVDSSFMNEEATKRRV
jgi:hypothetical protein